MTYPDFHPLGLQNVTLKMKSYTYRDTQKALEGNTNHCLKVSVQHETETPYVL